MSAPSNAWHERAVRALLLVLARPLRPDVEQEEAPSSGTDEGASCSASAKRVRRHQATQAPWRACRSAPSRGSTNALPLGSQLLDGFARDEVA